jgi:hypothetical protein
MMGSESKTQCRYYNTESSVWGLEPRQFSEVTVMERPPAATIYPLRCTCQNFSCSLLFFILSNTRKVFRPENNPHLLHPPLPHPLLPLHNLQLFSAKSSPADEKLTLIAL